MSAFSRNYVLLAAAYAIGLVSQGECSSTDPVSFIPRRGRRDVSSSTRGTENSYIQSSRGGDGPEESSIFDVDFYDDTNSRYADELEDVVDRYDFDDGASFDDVHQGYGEVNHEDYQESDEMQPGGKDALYKAYNELHTVAQEFSKPFDAPAVVVVGHQSSGKSALIEALMGFQFNQVGGGTKTRRPVALRMQYNPRESEPKCFLLGEDGVERPMSLQGIQDYIEKENHKLERDPTRSFDSREINVRVEYKYCPNMILIDTPGLIAAPKVPQGRNGAGSAFSQQRALVASAREAERLVVEKMRCQDYLILCVEDTSDWKHGATREIVQKADPDLSRTVIVNTKFDTKIPQFGTPSDIEDFLRASILDRISPHKLGGPFFTSVPSGRVGRQELDGESGDFLYTNDDDFVAECGENENNDRTVVASKLRRMGKAGEVANAGLSGRIGLSRLRGFLEQRVDESYRRNVAKIIPVLQSEYVAAERRLRACEKELDSLSVERLKAGADAFCDEFCNLLRKALQGSIIAPANVFGETLSQETGAAGSFHDVNNCPMSVSDRTWDRLVETEVGHNEHRLYGGSQYHRTLREFNLATKCLRLPTISEDEIANAAGVGTSHDGVNFLHAACVIALEKARVSFEPLLEALRVRVTHVMERLCPVAEYMLRENEEREKAATSSYNFMDDERDQESVGSSNRATDISQNPQFRQLVRRIFDKFVQKCSNASLSKCRDDLISITRYVTWNLDERSSGALRRSLPDKTDLVAVYQVAVQASKKAESDKESGSLTRSQQVLTPIPDERRNEDRDYFNLLQLMEEAVCSRDANRTNLVVGGLVQHIVSQWREQFGRTVTMKFNCYFMLPFVDDFHKFMRKELQNVYEGEGDLNDVFNLNSARKALEQSRQELVNECTANKRLQEKFDAIARMMRKQQGIQNNDFQ